MRSSAPCTSMCVSDGDSFFLETYSSKRQLVNDLEAVREAGKVSSYHRVGAVDVTTI